MASRASTAKMHCRGNSRWASPTSCSLRAMANRPTTINKPLLATIDQGRRAAQSRAVRRAGFTTSGFPGGGPVGGRWPRRDYRGPRKPGPTAVPARLSGWSPTGPPPSRHPGAGRQGSTETGLAPPGNGPNFLPKLPYLYLRAAQGPSKVPICQYPEIFSSLLDL